MSVQGRFGLAFACLWIDLLGTRLLVGSMPVKCSSGREFPEFVSHHVFRHKHRDEFPPVMDGKRQPD